MKIFGLVFMVIGALAIIGHLNGAHQIETIQIVFESGVFLLGSVLYGMSKRSNEEVNNG